MADRQQYETTPHLRRLTTDVLPIKSTLHFVCSTKRTGPRIETRSTPPTRHTQVRPSRHPRLPRITIHNRRFSSAINTDRTFNAQRQMWSTAMRRLGEPSLPATALCTGRAVSPRPPPGHGEREEEGKEEGGSDF
jgi:hypothetical protein